MRVPHRQGVAARVIDHIDSVERVAVRFFEAGLRICVYALIFVLDILGLVKVYELLSK